MNRLTNKEIIDKNMQSAMEANEAAEAKRAAAQYGYVHAMSLYGVITDAETGASEYRRIEVISNDIYNGRDIELIYRFFNAIKPAGTYTIWLYNKNTEALTLGVCFN
jgi:hypothetical protein